ncbi:HIT family protein [Phenylobacterium immobile]|uniref:HIT family protein n=1 Tax=Phenylobacterium immobile TaxID=21 RepID=UPI000AB968B0|nr:HIT family protein [Phenylobacterium immobile]
MSLDGTYDEGNIFAKIIRGDMPAVRVFEDDRLLAIMDVFPQSRGHALVIPKLSQARNLLEETPENAAALMLGVQRLAKACRAALSPDGIRIAQFNGEVGGQTVFHLHVHVLPVWDGQPIGRHGQTGMADLDELKALAERIAAKLS